MNVGRLGQGLLDSFSAGLHSRAAPLPLGLRDKRSRDTAIATCNGVRHAVLGKARKAVMVELLFAGNAPYLDPASLADDFIYRVAELF